MSVIESIALSPDDQRVALVGTGRGGRRDVFVADIATGKLSRITDDWFSEREVSWGARGIVYTSDSTGHGMYDLFRVADADRPVIERLTTGGRDALDPVATPDGRVLFVAHDESGGNIYEVLEQGVVDSRERLVVHLGDVDAGDLGTERACLPRDLHG